MAKPKSGKRSNKETSSSKPFITDDAASAYRHFLPLVQELPEDRIQTVNLDIEVARANVIRAIAGYEQHRDEILRKAPLTPDREIRELPSFVLGLLYAADRVSAARASEREIEENLRALRPMRELSLLQLEIFAALKLIPAERVAAIRSGTGPLDSARDGVAIAGLFDEHRDSVAHRHPFAPEQLADLARRGNWLIQALKPAGAVREPSAVDPDRVIRDRFFTEVVRRHDALRDAGVAAVGVRRLDESFPPLGARVLAPGVRSNPSPPTPPPADAPR